MNSITNEWYKLKQKKQIAYFPTYIKYLEEYYRDLVPFVQLKNREKHSWRSFTFSKAAG